MLQINNISLTLDNNKILDKISLSIGQGKIYGLIGPNGVGKTTLIKCLVGIYKVDEGEILYDGSNIYDNIETKKRVAYVADENKFFSSFKVRDIVKYYKFAYDNFDENKFNKLNKVFNVPLNRRLSQLSKGTKMRVSIIIALCQGADYIILDEPTSGLDPILKNKLMKILMNEVLDRGITIIISSHHLTELEKKCDDVAIIKDGKIQYENSLEEMKKKIRKIQVAFDAPVYEDDLNINGIYKISKVGRVFTIITDNYSEEFKEALNKFDPLFIEEIDLALEDIFIYRVGGEDDEEII